MSYSLPRPFYSRLLHVRFSDREFDYILGRYDAVGGASLCSLSAFLRTLLFISHPTVVVTGAKDTLLDLTRFRALGSMINAIAFSANATHHVSEADLHSVATTLLSMNQELTHLLHDLSYEPSLIEGINISHREKLKHERYIRVSAYQYERVQGWKRKENKSMRTVLLTRLCSTPITLFTINCDLTDLYRIIALTESNIRQINRVSMNGEWKATLNELMKSIGHAIAAVRDQEYALHKEEKWLRS